MGDRISVNLSGNEGYAALAKPRTEKTHLVNVGRSGLRPTPKDVLERAYLIGPPVCPKGFTAVGERCTTAVPLADRKTRT